METYREQIQQNKIERYALIQNDMKNGIKTKDILKRYGVSHSLVWNMIMTPQTNWIPPETSPGQLLHNYRIRIVHLCHALGIENRNITYYLEVSPSHIKNILSYRLYDNSPQFPITGLSTAPITSAEGFVIKQNHLSVRGENADLKNFYVVSNGHTYYVPLENIKGNIILDKVRDLNLLNGEQNE